MTHQDALKQHYDDIESRVPVSRTGDYATLVTPNGNSAEPIHRWFHFKEAFSHRLLERVLKDEIDVSSDRHLSLFDPFVGSGTTGISAGQLIQAGVLRSADFAGAECNPFLHMLSSAKLAALQAPPSNFLTFAGAIAAAANSSRARARPVSLSTFRNPSYFSPNALSRLTRLRLACDQFAELADPTSKLLAGMCLAATVEPASKLRRDGRTLRYSPGKIARDPIAVFLEAAEKVQEDLSRVSTPIRGSVSLLDVRQDSPEGAQVQADLALFSPPYPNNIDYTEVYKLELWALGLIGNEGEFASQRRKTLRSHGSLKWDERYDYQLGSSADEVQALIDPLIAAIPQNDRYSGARRQLVMGYTDDMLKVVDRVKRTLRPGGVMACIVGNSLHGKANEQLLIAADLLIARLAEIVGLTVVRIEVARRPTRRASYSEYLRESVVFARLDGEVP